MKRLSPHVIRPALWHSRASMLAAFVVLFLLSFGGSIEARTARCVLAKGDAANSRSDDCTTIVMIVDGMMKSRSGAT